MLRIHLGVVKGRPRDKEAQEKGQKEEATFTEGEMRALKGAGGDLSIWGWLKMCTVNSFICSPWNLQ